MNRDPQSLLNQLTPRGAGSDVRARIVAAVGQELQSRTRLHWRRWCELSVAAGLVAGIVSNASVSWQHERRLAELYGPTPVAAPILEVARAVESVTDKPTAQWVQQRFAAARQPRFSLPEHMQDLERFLREF